jgi:putative ABC transport system permease protein
MESSEAMALNNVAAISNSLLAWHAIVPNPFKHGRVVASIVAIACGVALGLAVYLVNRVAVDEFSAAIRQLSGTADLIVAGPRAGFSETAYPDIARLPQIIAASPVLEIRATLVDRKDTLKILGVDPFRAAAIHPNWFRTTGNSNVNLFAADTLVLSAAAAKTMQLRSGDHIQAQVGLRVTKLRVIDVLSEDNGAEAFALMDIANAQWRFERLGLISRVELRAQPGAALDLLRDAISKRVPPGVSVESPEITAAQSAELSKAYRVNMMILALVALFTGVFLVFSTQALAIIRRRPQLALLRVLGLSRRRLVAALLLEAAIIGSCGAVLGVMLGYSLAGITLSTIGADLGAGYFSGVTPTLNVGAGPIGLFLALGILVALAGVTCRQPRVTAAQLGPARLGLRLLGLGRRDLVRTHVRYVTVRRLCRDRVDPRRHVDAATAAREKVFCSAAKFIQCRRPPRPGTRAQCLRSRRHERGLAVREFQPHRRHGHYGLLVSRIGGRLAGRGVTGGSLRALGTSGRVQFFR